MNVPPVLTTVPLVDDEEVEPDFAATRQRAGGGPGGGAHVARALPGVESQRLRRVRDLREEVLNADALLELRAEGDVGRDLPAHRVRGRFGSFPRPSHPAPVSPAHTWTRFPVELLDDVSENSRLVSWVQSWPETATSYVEAPGTIG